MTDSRAKAEQKAAEKDAAEEAERGRQPEPGTFADGVADLEEYEVVMDHNGPDGKRHKIGDKVRLNSEQAGVMAVQGLVVKRADEAREQAHRDLMDDPSVRGMSN
jgi:hypothetical protein